MAPVSWTAWAVQAFAPNKWCLTARKRTKGERWGGGRDRVAVQKEPEWIRPVQPREMRERGMWWRSMQSCWGWDTEGLGVGNGKGCVSGGQLCQGWWPGSGGPCPLACRASAGYLQCALPVPTPCRARPIPRWSWALLLHARQVGQAATAPQMLHHEWERDWENTRRERAIVQAKSIRWVCFRIVSLSCGFAANNGNQRGLQITCKPEEKVWFLPHLIWWSFPDPRSQPPLPSW